MTAEARARLEAAYDAADYPATTHVTVRKGDLAALLAPATPWGWLCGDQSLPGTYTIRTEKDRDDAIARGLPVAPLYLDTAPAAQMIDSECIHPSCGCGDGPCRAIHGDVR